MGIQINGNTDNISATDGGLTVSDLEINQSGISTFNGNIDANGDLDVDGHTELDNVNIAGVTTFANTARFSGGDVIFSGTNNFLQWDKSADYLRFMDGVDATFGNSDDLKIYHSGTDTYIANATNNFRIGNTGSTNLKFFTNNSTRWNIDGSGHFVPDTDSQVDIGTNSVRVRNIYADNLYGSGANLTGISGVTIADQSNNELITCSGTTDALNAESNLTFDGTSLKIGNNFSAHSEGDDLVVGGAGWRGMTIYGEGGGGVIQFADDGNNRIGQILYNHGDNSMSFRTNGNVTRLRINSNGAIGINTTNYSSVLNNEVGLAIHGSSNDNCRINLSTPNKSNTLIGYYGLSNRFGVDVHNGLEIRDVEASYATRLRINNSGQIGINQTDIDADLHIATAGSSEEDGTLKIGGSENSLGLLLSYDQASATVSKITANPTYTNNSSLLKICVDGDANADQLVLSGAGKIGINIADNTAADLQVRTGTNGAGVFRLGGASGNGIGMDMTYSNSGATSTIFKQNYHATHAGALMQFDSGLFTFRTGTSPSESMRISSSGVVTKPYHPSFLAGGRSGYSGGVDNAYAVVYPATEYYDVGNNMNITNGRFTAPVSGKYFFFFCGLIYPMGETNFSQMQFRKNNSQYGQFVQFNGTGGNHRNISFSVTMDMSAGDYCTHTFYRSAGQSHNIYNSQWNFGGYLIG